MVNIYSYKDSGVVAFIAALFVLIGMLLMPTASNANEARFLESFVNPSTDISAFTKWTRIISSSRTERISLKKSAGWNHIINGSQQRNAMATLHKVNELTNNFEYIRDSEGWNVGDYWATPTQFFAKGGGDCEDFAIVKYMALRTLGWKAEDLRIIILKDSKINELHAVLAVNVGDETYILDNQTSEILKADSIRHYHPIYSINELAWWRYAAKSA